MIDPILERVVGDEIVFVSRVTVPFCDQTPPLITELWPIVIDVSPAIIPLKVTPVPIVTSPLTCQNTLFALAPLTRSTDLLFATVKVDDIWKTQTAFGSPPASSVRFPDVMERDPDWLLYTPGVSV